MKVKIVYEDKVLEFDGDVEEVYKQIISFFNKVIPAFELANKILVNIDINDLVNILQPYLQISREGDMIFTENGEALSMSNKIVVLLIGAKLLNALGIRQVDSLSLHEISQYIASTSKSVSSRLSELYSKGFVERYKEEGTVKYRVTLKGIVYFSRKLI